MSSKIQIIFPLLFIFFSLGINAQHKPAVVSGPMLAQVEMRTARIWLEVTNDTKKIDLKYWKKSDPRTTWIKPFPAEGAGDFRPIQVEIGGLDLNTTYEYSIVLNGVADKPGGQFTTRQLWQYQKPVPDFTFLTGSCAYFNEPAFDRRYTDQVNLNKLATPYGGDSSIFETMAKTPASFMLWLGDNWYTREADYSSEWGLWYRASTQRRAPVLKKFLKAMPQYAIWDDHDFGPNDADKSYVLKEASRKVFMNYWGNPSYGENGQGIYSKISYADADFFLMDARYFRSPDDMNPLVDGKANPGKRMWGPVQMEWLKSALVNSKATFKFIVTGSQTLNPASPNDCLQHYPVEFNELMSFLAEEKTNGIIFLTGDRHHSEVVQYERPGSYNLYDITSSPLTAGVSKVSGKELENQARLPSTLVEAQNFSKITISGKAGDRRLTAEFIGIKGEKLGAWSVHEKELKNQSQNN